jgi:hypothetical protein
MLTKRFMSPHLLTTCRTYIIKNANLALAFDSLGLDELFPKSAFKEFVFRLSPTAMASATHNVI